MPDYFWAVAGSGQVDRKVHLGVLRGRDPIPSYSPRPDRLHRFPASLAAARVHRLPSGATHSFTLLIITFVDLTHRSDRGPNTTRRPAAGTSSHFGRHLMQIDHAAIDSVLGQVEQIGLISATERGEILTFLDPDFPYAATLGFTDSVHAHVKVEDVQELPHDRL